MPPRSVLFVAMFVFASLRSHAAAPPTPMPAPTALAKSIDQHLADHWRQQNIKPAPASDDVILLRRVTIDLVSRIPTTSELDAFEADRSPDRYAAAVSRLIFSPEFSAHFATVLDEVIQGRGASQPAFVGYLRDSLRAKKGWDDVFREVMVGPWTDDARKPARLFLERRARDLDALTVDTTRAFFGVDISCARCHDHPLVKDWKREHYHGMTAFLVRTTGGKGNIGEKADGEAKFAGKDGKERTVSMMFLSGKTLLDPTLKVPRYSRREELVRVALDERRFFARAFVNRVWENYLGRGLVDPPDQMHSGNRPSVPALLDHLADDFAASSYDMTRLVHAVVLSRAYRLDGRWESEEVPKAKHFAVARLRPLSPRQMSRSLVVALGDGSKMDDIDKAAAELVPSLDPRAGDFQSSTREALFVSNSEAMSKLIAGDGHLAARLAKIRNENEMLRVAYRTILGRVPSESERATVRAWLTRQGDRRKACEDLVWALAASAEFRFNH